MCIFAYERKRVLMFIHVYFELQLVVKRKRCSIHVLLELRRYSDLTSIICSENENCEYINVFNLNR